MKRTGWGAILGWWWVVASGAGATEITVNRDLGLTMLHWSQAQVLEMYPDATLGGFDLNRRCELAAQQIAKAESDLEVVRVVAKAFLDLGDSNTRFLPPPLAFKVDYGWHPMTVGEECFVFRILRGSDAAKKGLALGDRLESVNGLPARRRSLGMIQYYFDEVDPQQALQVVVVGPGGTKRQLDLAATVTPLSRLDSKQSAAYRQRVLQAEELQSRRADQFASVDDVLIWRLRQAGALDEGLSRARKAKAVILDFRGNRTGGEADLRELMAQFFNHEVTAGSLQSRRGSTPVISQTAPKPFSGTLLVLVDGHTGQVPEIFARLVQLEDRGVVIGDRTAGALRWSTIFWRPETLAPKALFGMMVTESKMVMRDGRNFDGVGLLPDLQVRPTAAEIARRSDPALAKALSQLGKKITSDEAGKLMPWKLGESDL